MNTFTNVLIAFAALALINILAFGAVTWWARRHPIEAFVAATRRMLKRNGMTRHVAADGTVYWTGGVAAGPEAKTLVLLHGVNDQAGSWSTVVPRLVPSCRLIIPDLAGHGESEPRSGPVSLAQIVGQVERLLEVEGARQVTLVGNSMGGWIAMLYAFAHPDRVEELVLEDASGMVWPLPSAPLIPKTREDVIAVLHAVHGPRVATPGYLVDAMLRKRETPMARMAGTSIVEHLVDSRLGTLKMPVKLIWGRDDGVLPVAYAETLQQKIAGSTLAIIDNAAHVPHRQQAEKFVACLTATS